MAAVGWALGNQPGRPQLNAKLPDQLMKDMKAARDQGWGKITPVPPPLPHVALLGVVVPRVESGLFPR